MVPPPPPPPRKPRCSRSHFATPPLPPPPGPGPVPPAPRRDPPEPPPALPCALGPGPEPVGGAPLSSMGPSQLSEPTAGGGGGARRGGAAPAGGAELVGRDPRGGAHCLTGTGGLLSGVDGRLRDAGSGCGAEGESSTCRYACSCGALTSPICSSFSPPGLRQTREDEYPGTSCPSLFLSPSPKTQTTFSKKLLFKYAYYCPHLGSTTYLLLSLSSHPNLGCLSI